MTSIGTLVVRATEQFGGKLYGLEMKTASRAGSAIVESLKDVPEAAVRVKAAVGQPIAVVPHGSGFRLQPVDVSTAGTIAFGPNVSTQLRLGGLSLTPESVHGALHGVTYLRPDGALQTILRAS